LVISICFEIGNGLFPGTIRRRTAVVLPGNQSRPMEIVSGVVRSEIGTVTKDRTVLHQAILQKGLLAGCHVFTCKEKLTI
jgi:hypothetical protein